MGVGNALVSAFNRGIVSRLGVARTDIEKLRLAATIQTNWMPRVLGSMMLRPGLQYLGATALNKKSFFIPFIFSATDTAFPELTDMSMRVWVLEQVLTRPAVTAQVTNGSFNADLSGWTDEDQLGCTSQWVAPGYMSLTGTSFNSAIRSQNVTVNEAGIEHALRIVIPRGHVKLKVGTSDGDDSYLSTTISAGTHSLSFTPTGSFWISVSALTQYATLIDSITVEAAGVVTLPSPYAEADLPKIRTDQSADVIYIACSGYHEKKIERRSARSWSLVDYLPEDGPIGDINITTTTLTPSAIAGDITVTASQNFFQAGHVGALFRIDSAGQTVESDLAGSNQFTGYVKASGISGSTNTAVNTPRSILITIANSYVGTLTLQRSVGSPGAWTDVKTYASGYNSTGYYYNDTLDNQIIYYRIGFKSGNYTSGDADVTITQSNGSLTGIFRVTGYTSPTQISASVLVPLGNTTASPNWYEGSWSALRGYPSAVCLYNGRIWWAGKGKIISSVSGTFESFDSTVVGDSAPINALIGSGPVDTINWLLPIQRLLIGTDTREIIGRSSSIDEPLTPSNFNLKYPSTQGSYPLAPVVVDETGLFLQRSGSKVFRLQYQGQYALSEYTSVNLTETIPEIGLPGIVCMAVQRQPDTRIHCVRADGIVAVLISQPSENVSCWVLVQTAGFVEFAFTMPGQYEDLVYYVVRRTINGQTVRYLERWALETECAGGTVTKLADACVLYQGPLTSVVSGLGHLEGQTVVAWADGRDAGTYTVTGGQITLAVPAANVVAGLGYTAQYMSDKLAYFASGGTALNMPKRVAQIGFVAVDTHYQGIKYGPSLQPAQLFDMPAVVNGAVIPPDTVYGAYDDQQFPFNGSWSTDSRVCLVAAAPRPANLLALTMHVRTNEG